MTTVMPAVFIGHGSPMNTLESNRYTRTWAELGAQLPAPRAILAISAHWYINATAVTAMDAPRTIHDFYGFPDELFAFRYPAPGMPQLADDIAAALDPTWVGQDMDSWGLDHGTWSVLHHMFPAADVPVVQLSINGALPLAYHVEVGRKLGALRNNGVLIVGSGNVVHNLGRLDPSMMHEGTDWAHRFDESVRAILTSDPARIVDVERHADYPAAVPTNDHFLPVAYLAGIADAAGRSADVLVDGYMLGSLSMTSYTVAA